MGGFHIIEDRPTPKAVYNKRIYLQAAVYSESLATVPTARTDRQAAERSRSATMPPSSAQRTFTKLCPLTCSVARKSFKADFHITNNQTIANLTSVYLAGEPSVSTSLTSGAFFGAIFAWPSMERFGRRVPLQVASLVFIVGAILMTVATHQIGLQYAGRVITGLAVGVLTAVVSSRARNPLTADTHCNL